MHPRLRIGKLPFQSWCSHWRWGVNSGNEFRQVTTSLKTSFLINETSVLSSGLAGQSVFSELNDASTVFANIWIWTPLDGIWPFKFAIIPTVLHYIMSHRWPSSIICPVYVIPCSYTFIMWSFVVTVKGLRFRLAGDAFDCNFNSLTSNSFVSKNFNYYFLSHALKTFVFKTNRIG